MITCYFKVEEGFLSFSGYSWLGMDGGWLVGGNLVILFSLSPSIQPQKGGLKASKQRQAREGHIFSLLTSFSTNETTSLLLPLSGNFKNLTVNVRIINSSKKTDISL